MIAIGVESEALNENHQGNFNIYFGTIYMVKLGSPRLVKGSGGS